MLGLEITLCMAFVCCHSTNTNTNTNTNTASPSIPSHCPATTTNTINVGYYQSWSKYRTSTCHPLTANAIPVSTFGYTHLIYSFAGISPLGELEPYNGIMDEVELYRLFNSLKDANTGLKTLIAVGGWNFDQSRFTTASSTPASRTKFANSVVSFLQLYNFDGIDFDWEYPVTRQGTPADYDNYVSLVREVRRVMDEAGLTGSDNGGSTGLITMAIPCNPDKLNEGYDLPSLAQHLDWFHLMSYDIYGAWDSIAGSNTDMPYIEMTVDYILNQGVDSSQLTLGFASYGRSMKLGDAACATMGCPISGPGMTGCSGEVSLIAVCILIFSKVTTILTNNPFPIITSPATLLPTTANIAKWDNTKAMLGFPVPSPLRGKTMNVSLIVV